MPENRVPRRARIAAEVLLFVAGAGTCGTVTGIALADQYRDSKQQSYQEPGIIMKEEMPEAGFPTWTLVALASGSVTLVGAGLLTRELGTKNTDFDKTVRLP